MMSQLRRNCSGAAVGRRNNDDTLPVDDYSTLSQDAAFSTRLTAS